MEIIRVELAERTYPIYMGSGLLEELGRFYQDHSLGPQATIVTDEIVAKLYLDRALESLARCGIRAEPILLEAGERSKSLATVDAIFERLIAARFRRDATIIALGGGVIGDVAGFVAATFLRGVCWVQVPTTLVAQVDSSVGGKVGINHRLGKNLIGAFHQPRFVLIDPALLRSLPLGEWRSGLAEIIKYALIRDERFFALLEERWPSLAEKQDEGLWPKIIARCVAIKSSIVVEDEREQGVRRLLNFGHTIGHALEAALNYQIRHGEAVAWGMRAAAWLSWEKGLLSKKESTRVMWLLGQLAPSRLPPLRAEVVLSYVYQDKKIYHNKLHFVLLRRIGEAVVRDDVSEEELVGALGYLQGRR